MLTAGEPLERVLCKRAALGGHPFVGAVDIMPGMLVAACKAAVAAVRTRSDFEPTCAWRRTASAAVARIAAGRSAGDAMFWEGAIAASGHQAMRFARLARAAGGKRATLDLLRDGHHTMPRRCEPFLVQGERDVRLRIEDGVALLCGVLRLDGQPPCPRPLGATPIAR